GIAIADITKGSKSLQLTNFINKTTDNFAPLPTSISSISQSSSLNTDTI
ncbi:1050_t:CDS:1, partial [Racocetra persica]